MSTLVDSFGCNIHSQFDIPMQALSAILSVTRLMLLAAGLNRTTEIATTYKTVQSCMGIEPSFDILLVCVKCLEPHPANYKAKECSKCTLQAVMGGVISCA